MLIADELKYDVDSLTNVMMMAWMMSSNFDKFHQQCEQLFNGLVKYYKFHQQCEQLFNGLVKYYKFHQQCEQLLNGLVKYYKFLTGQRHRTATNLASDEPVRDINDSWTMTVRKKSCKNYATLEHAIQKYSMCTVYTTSNG